MSRQKKLVIRARGIAESMAKNMLSAVTDPLDKDHFDILELVWSASYGPVPTRHGESFGVAVTHAEKALLDLIRDSPYPVILIGFSGGAEVVGNVARRIARGQFSQLTNKVLLVGLLADPSRAAGQIVGPDRGGFGITGERFIDTRYFPVLQYSAPGDPISELPAGNLLRPFADISEFFSLDDPEAWIADLRRKAVLKQFQNVFRPELRRDWAGAAAWARGYLFDGRHTCYNREILPGTGLTYTEHLAKQIGQIW
nr:alpha/beta hydrolase [Rhodococcus sp. 15-1154-1]